MYVEIHAIKIFLLRFAPWATQPLGGGGGGHRVFRYITQPLKFNLFKREKMGGV
jgi:hypothetical protein